MVALIHGEHLARAPKKRIVRDVGVHGKLDFAEHRLPALEPQVAMRAHRRQIADPNVLALAEHLHAGRIVRRLRIRDEAHRFAVGFHRQRRESRGFASLFDELEGVGPARRRALLNHFGSVDAMLAATPEELEGVPGVPAKVARSVYAQLHKAGGGAGRA